MRYLREEKEGNLLATKEKRKQGSQCMLQLLVEKLSRRREEKVAYADADAA